MQRRAQTSRLERRRHRDDGRCCGDGEGGFGRRIGPVVKEGRPGEAPIMVDVDVRRREKSGDERVMEEGVFGCQTAAIEVIKRKMI